MRSFCPSSYLFLGGDVAAPPHRPVSETFPWRFNARYSRNLSVRLDVTALSYGIYR
jgi:hypothetical protein